MKFSEARQIADRIAAETCEVENMDVEHFRWFNVFAIDESKSVQRHGLDDGDGQPYIYHEVSPKKYKKGKLVKLWGFRKREEKIQDDQSGKVDALTLLSLQYEDNVEFSAEFNPIALVSNLLTENKLSQNELVSLFGV